jgi:predicted nucleic acid-binding protein
VKIYLDTSGLQRPLDNRTQLRIAVEAEAVLGLIGLLEAGEVELVSSDVLLFESRRNPRAERREYALAVLEKAASFVQLDETIEKRARDFEATGLKPLDALHLASAEAAWADYFCTTDDELLKRGRTIAGLKSRVVSPVELIEELES